jgi:hypothetical protein
MPPVAGPIAKGWLVAISFDALLEEACEVVRVGASW